MNTYSLRLPMLNRVYYGSDKDQRRYNPYIELDRLLEPPSVSIFYEGVEYDKKEHEREFLVLSRLARDLLLVPTTGVGIERLFNSALKEDKALKAIEEDAEPISDNKEIEESENLEEYTVVETGRSSIHRHIHEPKQEEESVEEDVVDYDEADLLPPPIIQLSDRSQKRSSGRVTMPSSRLRGYEVY
ncbi:hypothetical protein N7501_009521 [Penicillium viridicatum]|nr:hypothetical protein N7501_009521 [Penicillium viridicatum]